MTIRGTLALLVVLLVLAGHLALTRPPAEPAGDAESRLTPTLGGATAVEITHQGRTIRIERATARPRIDLDGLLSGLESLRVLAVIDADPPDAATYGFGPDALQLGVFRNTATIATIEVGAPNPAETGMYVRRAGNPAVLLVGALLRWELEKIRRVVSTAATP